MKYVTYFGKRNQVKSMESFNWKGLLRLCHTTKTYQWKTSNIQNKTKCLKNTIAALRAKVRSHTNILNWNLTLFTATFLKKKEKSEVELMSIVIDIWKRRQFLETKLKSIKHWFILVCLWFFSQIFLRLSRILSF